MTLEEAIDYVCTVCHRQDDASREEARTFVRTRHRVVYNSRLWRDTIDIHTMQGRQITNEFGEPLIDENGEYIYAGLVDQVLIMPSLVGQVIMLRWGDISTLETDDMSTVMKIDPARFQRVGDPMSFSIVNSSATATSPGGRGLVFTSTSPSASFDVSIRGKHGDNDRDEVITTSGQGQISSAYSYDLVTSLAKTSYTEDLSVHDDLGTPLLTLTRSESSRTHQRVHLHSTPRDSGTMMVLYKKRLQELYNDACEIFPASLTDIVLEGAISKMREGERQYAKAAAKAQEVMALMDVAIKEEREQAASNPRLIPYDLGGWNLWEEGETKGF